MTDRARAPNSKGSSEQRPFITGSYMVAEVTEMLRGEKKMLS